MGREVSGMHASRLASGQLAEWIDLERRGCPFFAFEIRWDHQNGLVWLHLDGSEGERASFWTNLA